VLIFAAAVAEEQPMVVFSEPDMLPAKEPGLGDDKRPAKPAVVSKTDNFFQHIASPWYVACSYVFLLQSI